MEEYSLEDIIYSVRAAHHMYEDKPTLSELDEDIRFPDNSDLNRGEFIYSDFVKAAGFEPNTGSSSRDIPSQLLEETAFNPNSEYSPDNSEEEYPLLEYIVKELDDQVSDEFLHAFVNKEMDEIINECNEKVIRDSSISLDTKAKMVEELTTLAFQYGRLRERTDMGPETQTDIIELKD